MVCFIERIFVVFKLDLCVLFPEKLIVCTCFFPNITYLCYNHNSLPASLSCDLVLPFFFLKWKIEQSLYDILTDYLSFWKLPALAIWLYFFFPSRNEDGQKKNIYTLLISTSRTMLTALCGITLLSFDCEYIHMFVNIDFFG